MRYCFDIDGTICTPGTCGKCVYEGSMQKKDRLESILNFYDVGYYILYFISRTLGIIRMFVHDDGRTQSEVLFTMITLL